MASPVAHSFAGFWTFLLLRMPAGKGRALWAEWRPYLPKLVVLVLLANLPDIDFFGALGLHANQLHRGFTHSLFSTVLVSLGLPLVWQIVPGFWRSSLLYFVAYGSHLLLDLLTGTNLGWTHSGYGIPLFWPWQKAFTSPFVLFYGVRHKNLNALFSLDNLFSCSYELAVCGTISLLIFVLWKQKLKPRIPRRETAVAEPPPLELPSLR